MVRFECVFGDRASTFGVFFALISRPNKLPVGVSTTTGTLLLRRIVLYGRVYGQGEGASYRRALKRRQRRSMSRIDRWANGPYEGETAQREAPFYVLRI